MPLKTRVKICGLSTHETLKAATDAGASYVGFMFFEPSPRNVSIDLAQELAVEVPVGVCKVAVTVDASDATWDAILERVPLDMLQLHGSETPQRVAELRSRFGLPVMKAIGIADAEDLAKIDEYSDVADQLLIDAKPPKNAVLPGGNGLRFDWRLVSAYEWTRPWMLAGGLTSQNVREAIGLTGAAQVDISSAVEETPGVKSPEKIAEFMRAVG